MDPSACAPTRVAFNHATLGQLALEEFLVGADLIRNCIGLGNNIIDNAVRLLRRLQHLPDTGRNVVEANMVFLFRAQPQNLPPDFGLPHYPLRVTTPVKVPLPWISAMGTPA